MWEETYMCLFISSVTWNKVTTFRVPRKVRPGNVLKKTIDVTVACLEKSAGINVVS